MVCKITIKLSTVPHPSLKTCLYSLHEYSLNTSAGILFPNADRYTITVFNLSYHIPPFQNFTLHNYLFFTHKKSQQQHMFPLAAISAFPFTHLFLSHIFDHHRMILKILPQLCRLFLHLHQLLISNLLHFIPLLLFLHQCCTLSRSLRQTEADTRNLQL